MAEGIRRGVALLDAFDPDWWREIDLDVLDNLSTHDDVLGQWARSRADGRDRIAEGSSPWRAGQGLLGDDNHGWPDFDSHTEDWKAEIERRWRDDAARPPRPPVASIPLWQLVDLYCDLAD